MNNNGELVLSLKEVLKRAVEYQPENSLYDLNRVAGFEISGFEAPFEDKAVMITFELFNKEELE